MQWEIYFNLHESWHFLKTPNRNWSWTLILSFKNDLGQYVVIILLNFLHCTVEKEFFGRGRGTAHTHAARVPTKENHDGFLALSTPSRTPGSSEEIHFLQTISFREYFCIIAQNLLILTTWVHIGVEFSLKSVLHFHSDFN